MKSQIWNAADYEKNSTAQFAWAQELIDKLNLQGNEHVLDIGCGDGKITAEIAKQVSYSPVVGIDQSTAMIHLAQTRYPQQQFPNLNFQLMDARQLTFNNQFTLAFSNATLHWIDDHLSVLQGIHRGLCSGGKLLLQMGGLGNAVDLVEAVNIVTRSHQWREYFVDFRFPYYFYGVEDYSVWLQAAQLRPIRVELIPKDMTHPGADGLAGWLRTTWFPYTHQVPEAQREAFISDFLQCYLQHHPIDAMGQTHVHMVRLEVEAQKL